MDDVVADRGVEVVVIMDVVVAARVLVVERVGVGMLEEVEVGGVQVVVEDCLVVVDGRSVDEVEAVP